MKMFYNKNVKESINDKLLSRQKLKTWKRFLICGGYRYSLCFFSSAFTTCRDFLSTTFPVTRSCLRHLASTTRLARTWRLWRVGVGRTVATSWSWTRRTRSCTRTSSTAWSSTSALSVYWCSSTLDLRESWSSHVGSGAAAPPNPRRRRTTVVNVTTSPWSWSSLSSSSWRHRPRPTSTSCCTSSSLRPTMSAVPPTSTISTSAISSSPQTRLSTSSSTASVDEISANDLWHCAEAKAGSGAWKVNR